jgi:DNA polymerase-3 subunit delta
MKIAPKAAESVLARPDAQYRCALLYGPDSGLVRERMQRIKKTILAASDDPFALVEMDEAKLAADPALLADELSAVSLMGGKRVIVIRDATDKLTKTVEAAAAFFHPDVFLLLMAGELGTRSSLRAWAEKEPLAAAIACYKDEARDVHEVIRKSFEAVGVRADRDATDYLAAQLGNDRYVTLQELEKIITYAGESKRVALEDVQALVDYNRDTHFDDVVNAVADKNLQTLDQTLTRLLREGAQPVGYLRALQRYFNRLYMLRSQVDAGVPAEQVIASLRPPVFFRQAPILARHVQQWNVEQIAKALKLLIEAELASKTSDLPPAPASHRKLMRLTQLR